MNARIGRIGRTTLIWLGLSVLAGAQETTPADAIKVETGRTGNIFFESQPVQFMLAYPGDPAVGNYLLRTYAGEEQVANFTEKTVTFASLPAGYYTITFSIPERGLRSREESFGVITDPQGIPRYPESPFAVDAGLSVASGGPADEKLVEKMATLVEWMGASWIRERFYFGHVYVNKEQLDFSPSPSRPRYREAYAIQKKHGLKITALTANPPEFMQGPHSHERLAEDLRDVYVMGRTIAQAMKGLVDAWEGYNEPDNYQFPPSDFVAYHKAFALGFMAGDPDSLITSGPIGVMDNPVSELDLGQDCGRYMDVNNFHMYPSSKHPEDYPRELARMTDKYRSWAKANGTEGLPVWVTECGDNYWPIKDNLEPIKNPREFFWDKIPGANPPADKRMTGPAQIHQAQFVVKSFVTCLSHGVDRQFHFNLTPYVEVNTYWSLLKPNLTPYPAYVAFAVMTRQLGRGQWLGRLPDLRDGVEAHVFETGSDLTAVVYADQAHEIDMQRYATCQTRVVTLMGAEVTDQRSFAKLLVSADPLYIKGLRRNVLRRLVSDGRVIKKRPPQRKDWNRVSPVVLHWQMPSNPDRLESNCWYLRDPTPVNLEMYNLSSEPHTAILTLSETGTDGEPQRYLLAPMDRQAIPVTLAPPKAGDPNRRSPEAVAAVKGFSDARSSVNLHWLVHPLKQSNLDVCQPERWDKNVDEFHAITILKDDSGGVKFALDNSRVKRGWWWLYPGVPFRPSADWSAYNALAFDIQFSQAEGFRFLGLLVTEGEGAAATIYMTTFGVPRPGEWKTHTVFFKDLKIAGYAAATNYKKEGAFDPRKVSVLRIGAQGEHSPAWSKYGHKFIFVVKNIRLLTYGE